MPADRRLRVGLNTGCGAVFRTKQWTLEGWVELATYLRDHVDCSLLLLGGTAEAELNRQILQQAPWLIDTGNDNSLEEFFGVVDACDMLVTSDSLGMHLAIALRKWVIGLFGSTSATEIDLYDRGEKWITDFECSPCYLKTCDKQPTCMQALRGETIGEMVQRSIHRIANERKQAAWA